MASKLHASLKSETRRARGDHRRGATVIEFAFVFVLFLATVVGMMDMGRAVWAYNTLAFATREGARYAIVHGTDSGSPATTTEIQNVVASHALGLDSGLLTVNTTWSPDQTPGSEVTVDATYNFSFVAAPLILSQDQLTLRSVSRMLVAY